MDNLKVDRNKRTILIGGAWPYANSSLHLGHLAALISGDFLKRYHRLLGDEVVYVSGTDCHGTPITERAKREGVEPREIAEKYHKEFKKVFDKMNFSYSLYTKTCDEYHKKQVEEMLLKIYKNGYIYSQTAKQPYCECCKIFKADRELELICPKCRSITKGDQCDCGYIPTEENLIGAKCRKCGNKTTQKEDTNLYFALSKFQKQLEKYTEDNKKNWRISSQNETEKYLKQGLKDRAITRNLVWGVDTPIKGFEDKKIYVWVEAVLGYITATKKYCKEKGLNWKDFWVNNKNLRTYMCHGKDNIVFHTIIFPALLLSARENYHLPDVMVATQFVNINSEKISKSKGNGITVLQMIDNYNIDSIRYYMISYGPENKDIDFTIDNYINVHNSDIVNKFGNFVNRTLQFKGLTEIPLGIIDKTIESKIAETYSITSQYIENLEFKKACSKIVELIEIGNQYYDERKPWIQKKENIEDFNNTIYTCAVIIANLSILFEPVMPETSHRLREYLKIENPSWNPIKIEKNIPLGNIQVLFKRIDALL